MVVLGVSSIAISTILEGAGLTWTLGSHAAWSVVHAVSSYTLCALVVVHLAMDWAFLAATFRVPYDPARRKAINTGVHAVATAGAFALGVLAVNQAVPIADASDKANGFSADAADATSANGSASGTSAGDASGKANGTHRQAPPRARTATAAQAARPPTTETAQTPGCIKAGKKDGPETPLILGTARARGTARTPRVARVPRKDRAPRVARAPRAIRSIRAPRAVRVLPAHPGWAERHQANRPIPTVPRPYPASAPCATSNAS